MPTCPKGPTMVMSGYGTAVALMIAMVAPAARTGIT